MKPRVEAILATVTSAGSWIVHANDVLQLAVTALTLLWWLRLWATRSKSKDQDPKDPTP